MDTSAALAAPAGSGNSHNLQHGFALNEFDVFPASGEVRTAQSVQSLEPKVMQVLVELVRSAGEVITAEDLFSLVWPRSVYSPVSVRRAINQLRKVFADDNKTLFKTYPKRGYALHARLTYFASTVQGAANDKAPCLQTHSAGVNNAAAPLARQRLHLPRTGVRAVLLLTLVISCALLLLAALPAPPTTGWQVSALQPLTASSEQESFSRFTPDNSAVVYLRQTDDMSSGSSLWLTSTDRQQQRLLYQTAQRIDFFSWLPPEPGKAANRLLLAARNKGSVTFFSLTLSAAYQLDSFQEHLTIPDIKINSPFYTDGSSVFYLVTQHSTQILYRANLSNGQLELLLSANQQFSPYRIAPAATAGAITLLGFDEQQRSQLKRLSLSSGEISDIATLDANWYFVDYQPAFGAYLLSDGKSLFTLDSAQTLQQLPFENYAFLHYPTLAPNGEALSYTHATVSGNIYQQALNGQKPKALTRGTAHSWQGSLSNDNKQLAYVSNKYGHSQIFVLDLVSGAEQLVYANPEQHLALSQPLWSPDDTKLAFARNQRLVVAHLTTATVAYFDQIIGLPTQWLDNHDSLLLRQSAKPVNRWYRFAISNAKQQAVTASELAQVIYNNERYALTATELQTASGNTLFAAPHRQQIIRHFAKPDGLYLVSGAPDAAEPAKIDIWFYSYATAHAEKLTTLPAADISDINQQQLLYSTFATGKDIHTVRLRRQ